jgi:hypothetical protein
VLLFLLLCCVWRLARAGAGDAAVSLRAAAAAALVSSASAATCCAVSPPLVAAAAAGLLLLGCWSACGQAALLPGAVLSATAAALLAVPFGIRPVQGLQIGGIQ